MDWKKLHRQRDLMHYLVTSLSQSCQRGIDTAKGDAFEYL